MDLSRLPSISILLESAALKNISHQFAVRIARSVVDDLRKKLLQGGGLPVDIDGLLTRKKERLSQLKLRSVINATGIVLHTNLGRAPLSQKVIADLSAIAKGYSNLELNLQTGKRGGRLDGVMGKLCLLTGAQSGVVVNNNAAATLLALSATANGKEVIVSRSELVEIGGSFRVPEVISQGGATLVEVGTTNHTRASDYQSKINENTGALLRVHSSNFKIIGFTSKPSRKELVAVARKSDVPLIEDLGSGLLNNDYTRVSMRDESISQAVKDGVQLVTFSGDKLLGGAQAGFILGDKKWIDKCRRHPLYRAFRVCKLSLAVIESTLQLYFEGRQQEIPIWKMLHKTQQEIKQSAMLMASQIPNSILVDDFSYTGGGALPEEKIPTVNVRFAVRKPNAFADALRRGNPSILVRVVDDQISIDPRTLFPDDYEKLVSTIQALL